MVSKTKGNMNDAIIRYVFDRKNETGIKNKVKGKKYKETGLLQIEIRKEGTDKRAYVSTSIRLKPEQFSDKNGFTCKNHDNARAITGKATQRFRDVESFVLSDRCKTIDQVKYWDKQDYTDITIEDFIRSELIRKDSSYTVVEYNNSFIRRLNEFGKFKYFQDIDYNKLVEFDSHLRITIKSEPTLYKRHSLFKGYIQEAINRGLVTMTNPYNLFKMSKGKSKDPVYLTDSEVKSIKEIEPNYAYLERARDLFLFQCFTGLAYIDLMNFNKDSVKELDGYKVIQNNRKKTDENFITLFLPQAERIANKYNYELPKLSNQKYNEYLKEIAKLACIKKPLVSHSARHTFATYLLNNDIPIETVSRALGHSNIKQTQHYARLLGKKVIEDMKKLL